jgi:hypothetical protein
LNLVCLEVHDFDGMLPRGSDEETMALLVDGQVVETSGYSVKRDNMTE